MMEKIREFKLEFVQYMPKMLEQGVLYISMEYSLIMHLCACGCGEKVATPLSSKDWKLYYDGESISLSPSIGNWDFPCKSHYWIKKSKPIFVNESSKVDEDKNLKNFSLKFFNMAKFKFPKKYKNKRR